MSLSPYQSAPPPATGKPPTDEKGVANPWSFYMPGQGQWGTYHDPTQQMYEDVPDLVWPISVRTYRTMMHFTQIAGLRRATINPIQKYHWFIRIGDADEKMARLLAEDFDLPIEGERTVNRVREYGRFSWREYTRKALEAPTVYGHRFAEITGEIKNGLWRMTEICDRPQVTIEQIASDSAGRLVFVRQHAQDAPVIPADRLVAHVWDAENGQQVGVSMLRDLYTPWLCIDRLMRTDLAMHDRNAMGVGIAFMNEDANETDKQAALDAVTGWRGGGSSGGVFDASVRDAKLLGVSGSTTNPLMSIEHYEQMMSRAWLAMLMELGQTRTGSRALGQTFVDFFGLGLDCLADWHRDVTQQQAIERWWNWNVGTDEVAPSVQYAPLDSILSIQDIATLIESGAIQVDDELEQEIRQRYDLPERTGPRIIGPMPGVKPQIDPRTTSPGEGAQSTNAAGDPGVSQVAASRDERSSSRLGRALASLRRPFRARAAAGGYRDPRLRRDTSEVEVKAAFDPLALDEAYQAALNAALAVIKKGRGVQVGELAAGIAQASSATAISRVTATPQDAADLAQVLQAAIEAGVALAEHEARTQGAAVPSVDAATLSKFSADRAGAIQVLLADELSQSARAKALNLTRSSGDVQIGDEVRAHLESLNDQWLTDQLSGAVTGAINDGRMAVFRQGPRPDEIYASEILDKHCCGPCRAIDGKRYPSLEAAEQDYPMGGYRDCLGGPRCRGSLVVIHDTSGAS